VTEETATHPAIDRHDRFMTLNYPRWPVVMVEGKGCVLTDAEGKTYLDLFSGFGAGILGHCHEDLVAAATQQVSKLWHVGNLLHTEPQTLLAEQIARKGFGGRSYFCHSGSDANEAAFKLARLYGRGKRHKIIATHGSFHGRGFAAMMATGQDKARKGFEPCLEGFVHVDYGDANAVADAVDDQTVAVIVEPIQGEGGVNVPSDRYLAELRKLCDEKDLLLICDEVWTGCGRTGKYFAYQHWGVEPDILTLGKAVGCGLPVGVMCAGDRVADLYSVKSYGGVPHATTLGGNCVSMAVAARLFEVLERDELVKRAAELGALLRTRLGELAGRIGSIRQIRGKGLFIGIELDLTGLPDDTAGDLATRCLLEHGLLIGTAQHNVLRLAPPLIVSEAELERGLDILERVLGAQL